MGSIFGFLTGNQLSLFPSCFGRQQGQRQAPADLPAIAFGSGDPAFGLEAQTAQGLAALPRILLFGNDLLPPSLVQWGYFGDE